MPDPFAKIKDLTLCYREEGTGDPPVLLIMGLASQLIHWPQPLVAKLTGGGYRVIRFDNRDSGLTKWSKAAPEAYSLADMAKDAIRLLDHLSIKKAHVVGASMGGMIAQRLAIDHSKRVSSLCSIMSTPRISDVNLSLIKALSQPVPPDREMAIAQNVAEFNLIGSRTHAAAEAPIRLAFAEAAYDRAPRPAGAGKRQAAAIGADGDRTVALGQVKVPTLVIHGNEDPLIDISGGRATRDAIQDAQWLGDADGGLDGMGHDLPTPLLDKIGEGILAHLERV